MGMMSVEEFRQWVESQNNNKNKDNNNIKNNTRTHTHKSEHDIQVECVRWFGREYPELEPYFWATPNGGYRMKSTAKMMKAEGQKAGVPDLQLAYPAGEYHGLFIEMKRADCGKSGKLINKGKASDQQKRRMEALSKVGYKCVLCYSFEQFREVIKEYLGY